METLFQKLLGDAENFFNSLLNILGQEHFSKARLFSQKRIDPVTGDHHIGREFIPSGFDAGDSVSVPEEFVRLEAGGHDRSLLLDPVRKPAVELGPQKRKTVVWLFGEFLRREFGRQRGIGGEDGKPSPSDVSFNRGLFPEVREQLVEEGAVKSAAPHVFGTGEFSPFDDERLESRSGQSEAAGASGGTGAHDYGIEVLFHSLYISAKGGHFQKLLSYGQLMHLRRAAQDGRRDRILIVMTDGKVIDRSERSMNLNGLG